MFLKVGHTTLGIRKHMHFTITHLFPLQTLYRYVLEDLYEHPALEKDLRELQEIYQLHRRK